MAGMYIRLLSAALLLAPPAAAQDEPLVVGSKTFTESIILGEIMTQRLTAGGVAAEHRADLGGTRFLWGALQNGDIDAYPEYTGTIRQEILADRDLTPDADLAAVLAEMNVAMSAPLGFNNTYALGMDSAQAANLGIRTISDLRDYPSLRFGFSNEFMDRGDGWPALRARYQLPQTNVQGLAHELAYQGIESGTIDVLDVYSTDAEIDYYNLTLLDDDLAYFPRYDAVILYRSDVATRYSEAPALIASLTGRIEAAEMIRLNAQAKIDRRSEAQIAADFLAQDFGITTTEVVAAPGLVDRLWQRTLEHLALVAISLTAAIVVAIPLGVVAAKVTSLSGLILGIVGVIYTIPSLALLVFMIPLLGIGGPPAVVALFLYSLLPIVRNTYTGVHDTAPALRESAEALGLSRWAQLSRIELPLASRAILAGIKTSAVINVGTATLGALIGAGGYGQPILTGIRLDDVGLILEGAIPAAVLALLVQGLFDLAERVVVPRGLRLSAST
jgi:osmoprotectant transport system permease protein